MVGTYVNLLANSPRRSETVAEHRVAAGRFDRHVTRFAIEATQTTTVGGASGTADAMACVRDCRGKARIRARTPARHLTSAWQRTQRGNLCRVTVSVPSISPSTQRTRASTPHGPGDGRGARSLVVLECPDRAVFIRFAMFPVTMLANVFVVPHADPVVIGGGIKRPSALGLPSAWVCPITSPSAWRFVHSPSFLPGTGWPDARVPWASSSTPSPSDIPARRPPDHAMGGAW